VEICVYPPTLLDQVRQALPCLPAAVPWLSRLHAIAKDPRESSRGLLGSFSSTEKDLIKSLFGTIGDPDPWVSIINHPQSAPRTDAKEVWNHAEEKVAIHPS